MLIENIQIQLKLESTSHSSTTSGEGDVKCKALNITYSVDGLSQASIEIVKEENNTPYYLNSLNYTREEFVGKSITVTWIRGTSDRTVIFTGVVTGIRVNKSAGGVSYGLSCTGGPLAMYNTSLSVKGWFPFGAWDNSASKRLFQTEILEGDWNTPKTLMKALVNVLTSSVLINPPSHSKAAQKQKSQLVGELTKDVNSLFEPKILEEYWGNVGKFETFAKGIRRRVEDLIAQESSQVTYWDFLVRLCKEIGLFVVPWIKGTMIIPNMLFTNSTKNNVIFPSMMIGESLTSDPFAYPDQVVMISLDQPTDDLVKTIDIVKKQTAVVFPEDEDVRDDFSPYAGNRYQLINPHEYPYLMYIYYESYRDSHGKRKLREDDQSRDKERPITGSLSEFKKFEDYCKNFAEFYFRKIRAEKDVGSVNMVFQPLLAPGFPCYMVDGSTGMNFRGVISSVSHSISENSASTSASVGFLVNLDEEISFQSPLWGSMVPGGGNVGPEVLPQAGGVPSAAAQHVTPKEVLSSDAMSDETKAAEFTGRIS
jgi:hypothetical protein